MSRARARAIATLTCPQPLLAGLTFLYYFAPYPVPQNSPLLVVPLLALSLGWVARFNRQELRLLWLAYLFLCGVSCLAIAFSMSFATVYLHDWSIRRALELLCILSIPLSIGREIEAERIYLLTRGHRERR